MVPAHRDKPLLLLVDGSSYLYRAFYALPPLTTSRGDPTGAVFGVINMLNRLMNTYEPDYVAVVFDAKGKTFRDDLFAEYKAHRPPMPDELGQQIEPLHNVVSALGLPLLVEEGVEADDVIGTLAIDAATRGIETVISTSDKDMAQLVGPHITLVNTMSDTVLDRDGVMAKFGVPPERIVDYLALIGDSSDNIPGVPKVGPKTAAKWLSEYGSLDAVVAKADDISGKVGESLRSHLDQLELSRRLATIRTDVPLHLDAEQLRGRPRDIPKLREWYTRLEFRAWLEQLGKDTQSDRPASNNDTAGAPGPATVPEPEPRHAIPAAAQSGHYEMIVDEPALLSWLDRLRANSPFAFDLETTSLDYMEAEIVGASFAAEVGHAAYVPVAHDYPGAPAQLPRDRVLALLKPLLEDPTVAKIGQNVKYDMSVLVRYSITLRGAQHDTMLESYVLNSTATRHDMDSMALGYLGYKTTTFEEVAGKGANQLTFNQVDLEQATHYAAEDADITLRLHEFLWPRVCAEPRLQTLFEDIEIPLVPVLSAMERTGVLVDPQRLRDQSREITQRLFELEQEAHRLAGQKFNLGSPKQLQEILFGQLKLPVTEKTPTGQPSTGESVLQELALDFPLPKVILEHRALSKLKSTYTDKLPSQINPHTGRVHTSYHQAVAATGRLSSSDPNLQNIPIRRPEGRRIRQAFVAPPGYVLLAADYSQIELRIMAHLSEDPNLLRAFSEGDDIHRATAGEIFGVPASAVTADQRRSAKAINFGLIYGMSAFGLARQLGIDRGAAQEYVERYFTRYPGVKAFMERMRREAAERGYVETVFGRRLYLPDIRSRNGQRRQYAERAAINAPMQGTAADIIKRAMIRIHHWLTDNPDVSMIMQVHDELVFEVPERKVDEIRKNVLDLMAGAGGLSVPLVVDAGVGSNWDEAH